MAAYSCVLGVRSRGFLGALVLLLAAPACGRSDLLEGEVFPPGDGGGGLDVVTPDAPPPDSPFASCAETCFYGCCTSNGVCEPGTAAAACGVGGNACQNCTLIAGGECNANGSCASSLPCSPANCAGCCVGTVCVSGNDSQFCGSKGVACVNCTATSLSGVCQQVSAGSYSCVFKGPPPPPSCTASNCPSGCCDSNGQCQAGFIDSACGQGGAACENCTAIGSTCDVNSSPRTCTSQQNQCPATYGGCAGGLQTPSMALGQGVCSSTDLQNAANACSAGARTTACNAFFSFEQMNNPRCGLCLSTFDYDFNQLRGVLACLAPFVNVTCNHDIACVFDCATNVCNRCPDAPTTLQCETQATTASCASYVQNVQTDGCGASAVLNGGAFCVTQPTSFGSWLQAVGTRFCGP